MLRKCLVTMIGLLFILALAACSRSAGPARVLTETDAGGTVSLKQGDILAVSLEGNLTTGFNWEAAASEAQVLRQLSETEYQPYTKNVGSPGRIILFFQAEKTGQQALKLVYHRSWEKNVDPAKTFEVKIVVE